MYSILQKSKAAAAFQRGLKSTTSDLSSTNSQGTTRTSSTSLSTSHSHTHGHSHGHKQSQKSRIYLPEVRRLLQMNSCGDDVPQVQNSGVSLNFESAPPASVALSFDKRFYGTKFDDDLKVYQAGEIYIEQGLYYANILYTFRSISRAIPSYRPNDDDEEKEKINRQTYEVLKPEMDKIKNLMNFQKDCQNFVAQLVNDLAGLDKLTVRESFLRMLIDVIDVLAKVDYLKDFKACLTNDYSAFKRSFQLVRNLYADPDIKQEEIQLIGMFLTNPNQPKNLIMHQLRDTIQETENYGDVILDMIKYCAERIESSMFMTPEEKYVLIRAIPNLLFLLDGQKEQQNSLNVFRAKKVPLKRLQNIVKRFPIVPQIGDLTVTIPVLLKKCPHYQSDSMERFWGGGINLAELSRSLEKDYSLLSDWKAMKQQHTQYAIKFSQLTETASLENLLNSIKGNAKIGGGNVKNTLAGGSQVTRKTGKIANLVLEGLFLLRDWNCKVTQSSAWKYTHEADDETVKQRGGMVEDNSSLAVDANLLNSLPTIKERMGSQYERVIKYNYSKTELSVLVDVISMIKSLAALISEKEASLAPILRLYMHGYVQQFLNEDIIGLMTKSDQKGRPILQSLKMLQELGGDFNVDNSSKSSRYGMSGGFGKESTNIRLVGPGTTQLHSLRMFVRSFNDGKGRGLFSSRDIDKRTQEIFNDFYDHTHFFPYLASLSKTIQDVGYLGDLWYREYFIEITKCTQFPIEMSLPCILTEHVIQNVTGDVPLMENIAFTLDVYNDAAAWTLNTLQLQHLYDEIEAEVNLVFDQIVYLISDEMFRHFKNTASSILLDKDYKKTIEKGKLEAGKGKKGELTVGERRFQTPANQRHVMLLGRSVDLNFLIGQHINKVLQKDIETAIKRFQSCDLSLILEFEAMINVLRLTHERLGKILLGLDSFEDLFKSANADVNAVTIGGKVVAHINETIIHDIITNYSYNKFTDRFVRGNVSYMSTGREKEQKPLDGKKNPFGTVCLKAWDFYFRLHRGFVGRQHFQAVVRLIGEDSLGKIMENLLKHVDDRIVEVKPYLGNLRDGLPPIKLPNSSYKTAGVYGAFETRLRAYLKYMDVLKIVFQEFRSIGNTVAVVGMLEGCLGTKRSLDFVNSAPFIGVMPTGNNSHSSEFSDILGGEDEVNVDTGVIKRFAMQKLVNHRAFFPEDHAIMTPMYRVMETFREVTNEERVMHFVRAPAVCDKITKIAEGVHNAYEKLAFDQKTITLSGRFLKGINESLGKEGFSETLCGGGETIMRNEQTSEFYRLFSVLNFLLCMENNISKTGTDGVGEGDGSDGDEGDADGGDEGDVKTGEFYGHGFGIAGVVILHLLGQTEKFKMLDFSYHVLRVSQLEEIGEEGNRGGEGGVSGFGVDEGMAKSARKFLEEAKDQKRLHDSISGEMDKIGWCPDWQTLGDRKLDAGKDGPTIYHPPEDDREMFQ